jgi:predicted anti-sigma-YlaC factor YlaD
LSTVAATSLPRWMVGVAPGVYGWLRGAYAGGWAHTHVEGAHTADCGAHTPIGGAHTPA